MERVTMKPVTINYRGRKATYMYNLDESFDIYVKYKNSGDLCKGYVEYETETVPITFAWLDYYPPADQSTEDGSEVPWSGHISEILQRFFETN